SAECALQPSDVFCRGTLYTLTQHPSPTRRSSDLSPEAGPAGDAVARDLLAWYDRHARDLPWRIPPGDPARPDPYRVWLSEVMLQDRKSTRLNSSHVKTSYAVICQ